MMAVSLSKVSIIPIPGLWPILAASPVKVALTETALGIFLGGSIGGLMGLYIPKEEFAEFTPYTKENKELDKNQYEANKTIRFQLREEQLDISKHLINTANVTMHKEVFIENKQITVPIKREELVIEKENLEAQGSIGRYEEILRIPLNEDCIEIIKKPVVLEDVTIYKNQFEDIFHIEEILKKERLTLQTTGSPIIVDENIENQNQI